MIQILLVDDQKTVRESLKAVLKSIPDFQVVGTSNSGKAAIAQVAQLHPDVVLVDMEMPGLDGIDTTRIICEQFTGVRVIILSMHDEDNYVAQAVRAGAMGYLIKNTPAKELEEAIRSVYRGYAQIGPGLLSKIIPISSEPLAVQSSQKQLPERVSANGKVQKSQLELELLKSNSADSWLPKKLIYGAIWLAGNIVLWSTTLLYLIFRSPSYSSSWTIALPATASSTSINLPEIGQASSQNQSPFSSLVSDPRENYKLLADSEDVIEPAAASLKMTPKEFGKPKVAILDNTTLMKFTMGGDTPQESKAKAIAVHKAFQDSLDRLKNIKSTEPDKNTLKTIKAAQTKLEQARQELANYQTSSGLNSNVQLQDLALNIERMHIEQAKLITQQQRTQGELNQLLQELQISPQEAKEALALDSDRLFGQYLENYSQIKTELVNLTAKYLPSHPIVIGKQSDIQEAEAAMLERASSILGRSVSLSTLSQLGLNSTGNQNSSQKENLLGELINLQKEAEGLKEEAQELEQQIIQLETRQKQRFQSGSELERLSQNVQIAEAVYSSNLTQLEIDRTNTANTYPPISLLTQPNLPKEPSSPKIPLVLLGSLLSSVFLTTALLSLCWRDGRDRDFLARNNGSINNQKISSKSLPGFEITLK